MSEKGTRCVICTGCGKCFHQNPFSTITTFSREGKPQEDRQKDTEEVFLESLKKYLIVDIGTTTIAMQLRCEDGTILRTNRLLNPQIKYGRDVLQRIEKATDSSKALKMQEMVQNVILNVIKEYSDIQQIVIAANTTMIHLFMGYEVESLGHAPFKPYTVKAINTRLFDTDTMILPGISAFIGADVYAGIIAMSMQESEEINLLLDLGTNGEMVLGNREKLIATSCAAGPAFEGNIETYGADFIKIVNELLNHGLMDETGLLEDPYFEEGILAGGVHISQQDIRQLQLAKAAIAAGIECLCEEYGLLDKNIISHVYLAGGMGFYLDVEDCAQIGLIPAVLKEKAIAVGNSSLEGTFQYLKHHLDSQNIHVKDYNLASLPSFERCYISHMNFEQY